MDRGRVLRSAARRRAWRSAGRERRGARTSTLRTLSCQLVRRTDARAAIHLMCWRSRTIWNSQGHTRTALQELPSPSVELAEAGLAQRALIRHLGPSVDAVKAKHMPAGVHGAHVVHVVREVAETDGTCHGFVRASASFELMAVKSCSFARAFEDPCARGGAEDAAKDDDDGDIGSARRASPGSPLRRFSRPIGSSVAPDASALPLAPSAPAPAPLTPPPAPRRQLSTCDCRLLAVLNTWKQTEHCRRAPLFGLLARRRGIVARDSTSSWKGVSAESVYKYGFMAFLFFV